MNPFRPGSGIFPPLLAGRERETAIFEARVARTREGQPQHTALLGEWAIGKTTLLMHWRRLRQQAGDSVVLSMAYPQSVRSKPQYLVVEPMVRARCCGMAGEEGFEPSIS